MGEKEEIFNLKVATLPISLIRTTYLQESRTREERLRAEERSKGMAGTRYENNRRSLEQSLKSKQEALQSKHRQGESVFSSSDIHVPFQILLHPDNLPVLF